MTTKKSAQKKTAAPKSMPKAGKDPKGGLTAEGRKFFNERDGSHLKPGVKGAADTPEKMVRKGSFLTRHFTHPGGPLEMVGVPTRLALSALAGGVPLPKTEGEGKKLAATGRKLLEQFHEATGTEAAGKKAAGTKAAGKKAAKKSAGRKAAKKVAATATASPAKSGE